MNIIEQNKEKNQWYFRNFLTYYNLDKNPSGKLDHNMTVVKKLDIVINDILTFLKLFNTLLTDKFDKISDTNTSATVIIFKVAYNL